MNLRFDVPKLERLGAREGTEATAEMMLELVEWMGSTLGFLGRICCCVFNVF